MLFDATADGRTLRVEVRGRDGRYTVSLDGRVLDVDVTDVGENALSLLIDGRSYEAGLETRPGGYAVLLEGHVVTVELRGAAKGVESPGRRGVAGPLRLQAPMAGKIVRLLVELGQDVSAAQGLLVMEAMKMENEIRAPRAGRVQELSVREGQTVETGALLAVVE